VILGQRGQPGRVCTAGSRGVTGESEGPGIVSLLALGSLLASPSNLAAVAGEGRSPMTVAGPRRIHTGFPLSPSPNGECLPYSGYGGQIDEKGIDGYTVSAVRIRAATEADLARIRDILNYYIEHTAFNFRTQPQGIDDVRKLWTQRHQRFPWLVAVLFGEVVGAAYAGPWNDKDGYQWTVESTVYVDPSAHRRGIGDALYTELLDRLRQLRFHSAIAVIALPNEPSVRLHERHGFTRVGHLIEAGYKHGAWHDVGFWQCRLAGR
jgi:phosphinothricin acetyltransferase